MAFRDLVLAGRKDVRVAWSVIAVADQDIRSEAAVVSPTGGAGVGSGFNAFSS
ncbi:hypothetical protein [Noviherbaspirillum pedocola]|uniref:Uncharacterized protein n=1 Tax=Noviherbaspirillum pedocola TaxID=2801341 RepID=A0A934SYF2_9BURK|nr:hypothetical protein [Noviherbaspirillum pedocola]MBK4734033.1 hypothetical protein [Noviherbaspirillum pedocola]